MKAEMCRCCLYRGCLDVKTVTCTVHFQCDYPQAKGQEEAKSKPTFKAWGG